MSSYSKIRFIRRIIGLCVCFAFLQSTSANAFAQAKIPADVAISMETKSDNRFLVFEALDDAGNKDRSVNGFVPFNFSNQKGASNLNFTEGRAIKQLKEETAGEILISYTTESGRMVNNFIAIEESQNDIRKIPLWYSILPPLLAIFLALIFREVIVSLFAGIWLGTWILGGFGFKEMFTSVFTVVQEYIINAISDVDHLAVIVFSILIGGMVAIISRNGGMAAIVKRLSRYANSARNSQLVTYFLGIAIFFDDYANTLIVGNTMRPVTDKFRISREKLAYLVDSTAAPVAAIAFVTTWIGAELGYIEGAVETLGLGKSAYTLFINSLAYSFYPILTLSFILILILQNRDYGPMLKAENRARTTGKLYAGIVDRGEAEVDNSLEDLKPIEGVKEYSLNALLPVLTVIFGTIAGIAVTGYTPEIWNEEGVGVFRKLSNLVGNSDSYSALIWSSTASVIVAILCTVLTRTMRLTEAVETMIDGFKTMLPAIIILIMAWSLAQITKDLHTADWLTGIMQGNVSPVMLPGVTFILAAIIAFSTGSSWGTMAILYPLILPASWMVSSAAGYPEADAFPILYNVISCVLAGAVLGDHCSPISDTTILSSLATSCNHIDHVRTQLPYALTVGFLSLILGYVAALNIIPTFVLFLVGVIILWFMVRTFGKKVASA